MESNPLLFHDLAYIFIAATAGGFLAWSLNLPLILGFVVGGIAISPFTPGLKLSDVHTFHEVAETGVVLLMFSIGVEFSVPDLLRVKWIAVAGGTLGISLSMGLAILTARLVGWSAMQGAVIGATVSVASTMVLAQLLHDRGAMGTSSGRAKIGITLFEDLAVVLMTVVLPTFGSSDSGRLVKAAWTLGKVVVLLVPLVFLAIKVIPILVRRAERSGNKELVLLVGLCVCLGTAALAQAIGFSVALGAFIAGLAISGSKDLHEVHDRLLPLRNALICAFLRVAGNAHRSADHPPQLAAAGHHAALDRSGQISDLVVGGTAVSIFDRQCDRHRRWIDANRRTVVRRRGNRRQRKNGGRRRVQCHAGRIADLDLSERFPGARRAEMVRAENLRPAATHGWLSH